MRTISMLAVSVFLSGCELLSQCSVTPYQQMYCENRWGLGSVASGRFGTKNICKDTEFMCTTPDGRSVAPLEGCSDDVDDGVSECVVIDEFNRNIMDAGTAEGN